MLAWSAVAAGQSASAAATPAIQSATPDPFATLREEWARNLHNKRIDASVAEYAEDADFLDPGANNTHGTAAIRKLFETVTATFDSDLTFHSSRVENSGDLAYDSGSYHVTLTVRATGKQQKISGNYLTIYRRSKNGAWLIVEQMWTMAANTPAQ